MLMGLYSDGKVVSVSSGYNSLPFISENPSQPFNGFLRYINGLLQINNNGLWITVTTQYPTISSTTEMEQIMEWAKKKMEEDRLASEYAIVKSAQENLQATIDLVKDY